MGHKYIVTLGEWPIDDVLRCSFLELSLLINDYESLRLRFEEFLCGPLSGLRLSLGREKEVLVCPNVWYAFGKIKYKIRWPSWPIPKVSV